MESFKGNIFVPDSAGATGSPFVTVEGVVNVVVPANPARHLAFTARAGGTIVPGDNLGVGAIGAADLHWESVGAGSAAWKDTAGTVIVAETLTGTFDGVNLVFTTVHPIDAAQGITIYDAAGVTSLAYSVTGASEITFATAPAAALKICYFTSD